jgi:hypothetical protein
MGTGALYGHPASPISPAVTGTIDVHREDWLQTLVSTVLGWTSAS